MVQFHDRIWGPDVSSWQGDVDWSLVKGDGASFGITKATEGTTYVNPYALGEWAEMGSLGMVRVQYHYARPAVYSASEEAAFFLSHMLPLATGDIIALDLEIDSRDGAFTNAAYWANSWLEKVRDSVGFNPMLYCNAGIILDPSQRFQDLPDMGKDYGLWLASWQEVFPKPPAPWDTVALWQFTNSGRVPGIGGSVDLNIFNGTLEQMRMYGKQGGGKTPPGDDDLHSRLGALADRIQAMAEELADLGAIAQALVVDWGKT